MPTEPAIDPAAVQWDQHASADSPAPATPEGAPDASGIQWDGPATPAAEPPTYDTDKLINDAFYKDIDMEGGLSFLDRTHLAQADSFKEKKRYLQRTYGDRNVSVDWGPDGEPMLVVKKNGKKIRADGGGAFSGFGADIVGNFPELAGMGAGAMLGGELGAAGGPAAPLTVPGGALLGGVVGAMTGKSATEAQKGAEGNFEQSPEEYASNLASAGLSGLYGEGGGQLVTRGVSKVARGALPRLITQSTPERDAMTDRLLTGGARPPAASTMPGAKRFQFMETLGAKAAGGVRAQDTANAQYIENRMTDILRDAGVPEAQVAPALKELGKADSRVSTAEAGEHVKRAATAHREMLENNVGARLKEAQGVLDQQASHLDKLIGHYAPGDLGIDVASGIKQSRQDFATSMSKVYGKVDQMVGDKPLVPTKLIRQAAARIAKLRPRSAQAGVTREMAELPGGAHAGSQADLDLLKEWGIELPPDGKISFADAQRIRTLLRERSEEDSLTRGVTAGEMASIANAVDYSIQAAAKDPAAAPAVRMLNQADKLYGQGIKKFNDATVNQLLRDLRAGIQPNPETIAQRIVQPGNIERMQTIRKMVGGDVWKRVASADYSRLLRDATDDVTGMVDGASMLREVRNRGEAMSELYGASARDIEELAKTLAARDGKLPVDALQPGQARHSLQMLRDMESAEDDFMKKNALSILASPKGNPERAYSWLVRPENASALESAMKTFGEDSQAAWSLRRTALNELLTQSKMSVADGRAETALTDALKKFTPRQKQLLFPGGMDDDLQLLGREIESLMKPLTDESKASFAAGAVLGSPFMVRIPMQVGLGIYQTILQHPGVIRYLALGLRQPSGPARRATKEMLQNLIRFGAVAPDTGSDEGAPQAPKGAPNGESGAGTAHQELAHAG